MATYSSQFSERFLDQAKKLDRHQRELIFYRIAKIQQQPELGKPLHAPLSGYRSERLEHWRIIYKITGNSVFFAWLEPRKHAYH